MLCLLSGLIKTEEMREMNVKIKKIHEDAILPTYATPGSACFDIYANSEGFVSSGNSATIRTGLAFEIPENHVMLVFSRSGHGFKNGVRLANCTGVIDSDYRGELMVKLSNNGGGGCLDIRCRDRIAQAMIIPYEQVSFELVDELSSTERGTGGFGSSGK
jgi:dUTP pyrophosphatase